MAVDDAPGRDWRLTEVTPQMGEDARRLAAALGVHEVTARCLVARGLTEATVAGAWLAPRLGQLRPPLAPGLEMAGFADAVGRLTRAVTTGEVIGIFGDYDVDGVTTTALLTTFLRQVGAQPVPRVARRGAGYGFGVADADALIDAGARLIVTVDCGTSDLASIEHAKTRGVDVIVVDHHHVPDRPEHPAVAFLNPHRPDSAYPFRGLASAGLGFFLAAGLRTALDAVGWFATRPAPDVRDLLDLAAIGTVADLAPLTDENRVLVSIGLAAIARVRRPGVVALARLASLELDRPTTEIDVGWKLGPRLNAPGRLGDATPALELLLATTDAEANALAAVCERANVERRSVQEHVVAEAVLQAETQDAAALVVSGPWNPGVVGIVAAKLVERFGRPAAVIGVDPATGEGRGSVRTTGGFDVVAGLTACAAHLIRFGGHKAAGGFSIAPTSIDPFRAAFAAQAERRSASREPLRVDAVIELGQVSDKLATELRSFAPFGPGNAEPVVATHGARVHSTRRVGEGGAHLKMVVAGLDAIAFRMGDRDPGPGATVDVAFRPEISYFRGTARVELRVHELRPASAAPLGA